MRAFARYLSSLDVTSRPVMVIATAVVSIGVAHRLHARACSGETLKQRVAQAKSWHRT